jgi:ABC-2 type transport system permease protein
MSAARAAYAVWRRELKVTLRAPIVYVIGGLFLAVQGIAFAGLVSVLSDPMKPAPLGELLEGQLAGTLLTWVLQLVVLTLLGMRTIADDKRSGAWELLLTAQVSEGAAVIGKWLAAATVYALLWIPTLAYLVVVAMFRVDDAGWDLASIATGYAAAIALGAALLAWAVAASAATATTLVAGAFAFALLIGLFLLGELPAAFPDLATDHPTLAGVLATVSLRGQLTTFARGEVMTQAGSATGVVPRPLSETGPRVQRLIPAAGPGRRYPRPLVAFRRPAIAIRRR